MSLATVLLWLGLMLIFLFLNGLFVAAEYAMVKFRRTRVQELVDKGHRGARTVQQLQKNMGTTIAGTQLGITLASLALGWIGENAIHDAAIFLLGLIPGLAGVEPPAGLGFAFAFVALSMLHVIVGEQVPKSWALRLPEKAALFLATPLRWFCFIAWPLIWIMSSSAGLILKLLKIPEAQAGEFPVHSADEFEILFEASRKAGTLEEKETDLLKRALELKELTVRQVMVPRTRMDCISDNLTLSEVLAVLAKTKHSKLPVFKGNTDNVVGILNSRDLFDWWHNSLKPVPSGTSGGGKEFRLSGFLRQVHFVPDSMPAGKLLEEMRTHKFQMAMVIDEFGGTNGLLTLEDLLEQLVGEIWDEYDTPQLGVESLDGARWRVSGDLTLLEFNKALGVSVSCNACITIAGAVIEALGRQPAMGDTVELGGLKLAVAEMHGQAISKLDVTKLPPVLETPESE